MEGDTSKHSKKVKKKRQKRKEVAFNPTSNFQNDRADKTAQAGKEDKTTDTTTTDDRAGKTAQIDDDDMTLADYGKRVREAELEGRGVRQRGGSSSSSGPAPPPQRGTKRRDDEAEQLNPLRPDLQQNEVIDGEQIGNIVIECSKLGSFVDGVDVAELFNPERFAGKAASFGLLPGTSFDLRCGWKVTYLRFCLFFSLSSNARWSRPPQFASSPSIRDRQTSE